MPARSYRNVLYPLQDRVMTAFRESPFYLTGGTVLSRAYYRHRYSDDLDYFVNDLADFRVWAERLIGRLTEATPPVTVALRDERYYRLFTGPEKMKVEMVNDVAAHVGAIVEHATFGRIDTKENILANKITVLIDRSMPKDVADVYVLLRDGLDLRRAFGEAESKAAGITPLLVAKVLSEFDYRLLDTEIRWVRKIPSSTIGAYFQDISRRIVTGKL